MSEDRGEGEARLVCVDQRERGFCAAAKAVALHGDQDEGHARDVLQQLLEALEAAHEAAHDKLDDLALALRLLGLTVDVGDDDDDELEERDPERPMGGRAEVVADGVLDRV